MKSGYKRINFNASAETQAQLSKLRQRGYGETDSECLRRAVREAHKRNQDEL